MADIEDLNLAKVKPEKFGDFDKVDRGFLPTLRLNSDQIPEIHKWELKRIYRVVFDIEQEEMEVINERGTIGAGFKVRGYKVIQDKPMDEMTDAEFGEFQGRALAQAEEMNRTSLANNIENN